MKKFLLLLLMPIFTFSSTVRVANFNSKKLGEDKKSYVTVAKILKNFDIIGIEEVIEEKGLELLVKELKKIDKDYEYAISKESVGSNSFKEYYGLIYKKSKLSSIEHLGFYPKKEFIRPPYGFLVKSDNFDFVIVLSHSIYGKDVSDRISEASKYINVYKYFLQKSDEEDILLMGDFNLPASNKGFDDLRKYGLTNIFDPNRFKTTLSERGLANSYDNIWLDLNSVKEFNLTYGIYNFAKDKNYKEIREYISDHIVIFIDFDTTKDLDR